MTSRAVFAVVGTDHHAFDRLVQWADAWQRACPEDVVTVQHGASAPPQVARGRDYLTPEEFREMVRASDVVITHGGPATIMDVRANGHKPIILGRDPGRGEHVDDHQMLFVEWAAQRGLGRLVADVDELEDVIERCGPGGTRDVDSSHNNTRVTAERVGELVAALPRSRRHRVLPRFGAAAGRSGSERAQAVPGGEHVRAGEPSVSSDKPVTVVIATRDRPVMLREAIASVVGQDYAGRIEVVVVYDRAVADQSLCTDDGRRSVRVVENGRTPGLAGARNTGILGAATDFVAFCDDDDYWSPGKLRRQVAAMELHPEALLSTCGITVEYDGDRFDRVLDRPAVTFEDLLRDRLAELHPSTFLLRRDTAGGGDFALVDEDVPGGFGEDYEFLLRAARHHPVANVTEALVVVRWGAQSFFFRKWQTMADGLSWLLERYPEFETVPRGAARVRGQIAFAEAAMGNRRRALRWAGQAVRSNPAEGRAFLATAVAARVLSADRVMVTLHRRGKGI